ncbi:hypothetical protein CPB86DRAFT_62690 [Serendipita vermifera]|nr:hypothetical protein CPB86DRAFT_62690 [Serendipita vermifera]
MKGGYSLSCCLPCQQLPFLTSAMTSPPSQNPIERIFPIFRRNGSPALRFVLGVLFYALIFTVAILLNPLYFAIFKENKSSPIPRSREVEAVSGLYGPGTYAAWVLCTVSAIISSATASPHSSILSSDQVASFIYSRASKYWYYGRVLWYSPKDLDLIQDCSIQAASFIFNVSTLLHGFGLIFSTEAKRRPWLLIVLWDTWLWLFSPMNLSAERSALMHYIAIPVVSAAIVGIAYKIKPAPWKLAPFLLLPFVLLEAPRTQFFITPLLILPKSGSSFTDLDQLVSLITAIAVVIYQWELWNLPKFTRKARTRLERRPIRTKSMRLEFGVTETEAAPKN